MVRGVVAESVIEYGPELRRVSVWVWPVRVKRLSLMSGENEFRPQCYSSAKIVRN